MSCAFCGMPPRDGEPCCTSTFKYETMRRADRRIKQLEAELAALRRRAQGVDVEAASRAIDNAILLASVYDGVAIDKDKVMADLAALRRALARETGGV